MEDETLIEREIFDILFRSQAVTRCIPPDSPAQGKKLTLRANCNEAESGQIFGQVCCTKLSPGLGAYWKVGAGTKIRIASTIGLLSRGMLPNCADALSVLSRLPSPI